MDLVVNFLSRNQIITDVGNKVTTEALPKPFVDRISTSSSIIPESFDVKFYRLKRIFENDKCVMPIYLTAEDGLKVVYKNVQSNVYLSDDKVEISQNYFIKQCCTLVSSKYHYPVKSVADNALMTLKAKKFSSTHNNTLPVLFLIQQSKDVSTDALKVFAYYSEIYIKSLLPDTTVVFVDVSIDKLYHRLINFIFIPTDKIKHLFSNYEQEQEQKVEYFGCVDSDIRINKRTFQIRFDNLLPYDEANDDDRMSKFANLFIQWYTSSSDDRSGISFSNEQIKDFIAKVSVVETFYPIQNAYYVFEKFYREYKRLNDDDEIAENDENFNTSSNVSDSIDPFCILSENVQNDENIAKKNENLEKIDIDDDNVFRVDHDVYVYDFKNFTASIFLHFFPDEPIVSETIRLLIALKESSMAQAPSKGFLLKLFGYSKHISNCPLYNFCNNFGVYFMCRLANLFIGKTLLCCRDSIFLCEPIDFSIFDDDDFYVKNLILENHFDRFFYSDYTHYVGYSAKNKIVVLKGFFRKNVPRFQMDLLESLFLDYFERVENDFDFWSSFNRIFQSDDDVYRLTFSYSGATNARYFYYNRLEDDFFVYSDEIEHRSLDKQDDLVKCVNFRTIGRCYSLCFSDYLKCLMCGIVQDKLVSSILKVDESVLEPFRRYCGLFMTCDGSFITPNVMGSFVYSSEYLWYKYGVDRV